MLQQRIFKSNFINKKSAHLGRFWIILPETFFVAAAYN